MSAGTPGMITVSQAGHTFIEPVLGAATYPDGAHVLITHHTVPWAPDLAGPAAYKLFPGHTIWHTVWELPEKWVTYITTQPVGTVGKVSNRRLTIVDHIIIVPNHINVHPTEKSAW